MPLDGQQVGTRPCYRAAQLNFQLRIVEKKGGIWREMSLPLMLCCNCYVFPSFP